MCAGGGRVFISIGFCVHFIGPTVPRGLPVLRAILPHLYHPLPRLLHTVQGRGFRAVAGSAPPAHPTGGGGTFCVRFGMYVSPRMKILGGTHPPAGTRVRCRGYFSSMLLRMSSAISSFAKSKTVSPSPVFASVLAPSEISSFTISECPS